MRECGPCMACCTVLEIPEIEKPADVKCRHACQGCAIYETRPDPCRTYFCLWADPKAQAMNLPSWARPDNTGVILNSIGPEVAAMRLVAFEVSPGAADRYWGARLLGVVRKRGFNIAVQHAGKVNSLLLGRTG